MQEGDKNLTLRLFRTVRPGYLVDIEIHVYDSIRETHHQALLSRRFDQQIRMFHREGTRTHVNNMRALVA